MPSASSPPPNPTSLSSSPPSPPSKSAFLKNLFFSHSSRSILGRSQGSNSNHRSPPQKPTPLVRNSSSDDGEENFVTSVICRQKNQDRTVLEVFRLTQSPPTSQLSSPVASPSSLPAALADSPSSSTSSETPEVTFQLVHQTDSCPSYHFSPLSLTLSPNQAVRLGRKSCFSQDSNVKSGITCLNFYSQVVSRSHAEITCYGKDLSSDGLTLKLRDLGSASGTFLNGRRLSSNGVKSKEFKLYDGDLIRLGMSYHDGSEEKFRCVQIRLQISPKLDLSTAFSRQALKDFRHLSPSNIPSKLPECLPEDSEAIEQPESCSECCICLESLLSSFPILLLSCGHTIHFECISHLIEINYPHFCCPVCRSFVNLGINIQDELAKEEEEDVEKCGLCLTNLSIHQSLILLSCNHVNHFQCVYDRAKKLGKDLSNLSNFACCDSSDLSELSQQTTSIPMSP